jgi:MFS family permease
MLILLGVSSFCLTMTLLIKADESKPEEHCADTLNPIKFFIQSYRFAATMKGMNFLVFGLSAFWMIGSFIQMNLMVHCPKVLGMTNTQTGLVMTIAAVGIGLGCYLAGVISKSKVELGLTPIGGVGMTISLGFLYFGNPVGIMFSVLVFFVAIFSGIFMIPLSAYIQTNVKGRKQGDIIAYSNFTVFVLILLSAGIFGALVAFFSTNAVFLMLFCLTIFTTVILLRYVPGMADRFKNLR